MKEKLINIPIQIQYWESHEPIKQKVRFMNNRWRWRHELSDGREHLAAGAHSLVSDDLVAALKCHLLQLWMNVTGTGIFKKHF